MTEDLIQQLVEDNFVIRRNGEAEVCHIDYHVEKVTALDGEGLVLETEEYLEATIKWDGCCHITFGDKGYLHLCGVYDIMAHLALIRFLWTDAAKALGIEEAEIVGEE